MESIDGAGKGVDGAGWNFRDGVLELGVLEWGRRMGWKRSIKRSQLITLEKDEL